MEDAHDGVNYGVTMKTRARRGRRKNGSDKAVWHGLFLWNFGSVNVCLRDVLNVRGLNVDEEVAGNLLTF